MTGTNCPTETVPAVPDEVATTSGTAVPDPAPPAANHAPLEAESSLPPLRVVNPPQVGKSEIAAARDTILMDVNVHERNTFNTVCQIRPYSAL